MYKMYICSVVNADILCTFAVAPHTGAWIEIKSDRYIPSAQRSLPIRERGLKSLFMAYGIAIGTSLPIRERGLKFC